MGRIERFTSRTEAELARSMLDAAGIPAYVSGDDAGGLHPEIPYGIGGTAVVVPDDRHREACDLLDFEVEPDTPDDDEPTTEPPAPRRRSTAGRVAALVTAGLLVALLVRETLDLLLR